MCSDSNLLISPETLEFIKAKDHPFEFLRKTLDEISKSQIKPMVLTIELLQKIIQTKSFIEESTISKSSEDDSPNKIAGKIEISVQNGITSDRIEQISPSFSPEDLEETTHVNIIENIVILKDATGLMLGEGKIEDIRDYFQSRYEKLRALLLKRPDCKGALSITQAKTQKNSENTIKVIGVVLEKNEMSSKLKTNSSGKELNSINILLDDSESTINVIFSGKNETLIKKANKIILDQVICVEGFLTEDEKTLIASDVFRPDVPYRPKKNRDIPPISIIFLSDIHFGSKYFLADKFEAFIDWLKTSPLARFIKYIIIAGDLIDGVGVYPSQEKNLAIIDITEQYELAAEYLNRIPKHIKIIIVPGGPHDAVRKAYPQPALSRKYAESLYELENVILLGNPAQILLHGVNILIYHGDSLDDLIQVIPGSSYERPAELMKELLINRHLTPIYGSSTWIAPEKEDWMVIEEIPEIFHCGHTHISDLKEYRGVILLNSGTFQAETDYQRSLGIKPTPAKFPIINLQTLEIKFLQF